MTESRSFSAQKQAAHDCFATEDRMTGIGAMEEQCKAELRIRARLHKTERIRVGERRRLSQSILAVEREKRSE